MTSRVLLILLAASACASPESLDEKRFQLHDATTVVALTFDDTFADNFQVGDMAAARDMPVTFYVNSSRLGQSGYMTRNQLLALQQQGHEIGGHTITHARLTLLSEEEMRDEVCNDRAALIDEGFRVTSFAYPFAADNPTAHRVVEECGYNSARDVGGLVSPGACSGCPFANDIPPDEPYALRTSDSVNTGTSLAELQEYVLQAERNGGGFVPIVFHHVCNGCNPEAITPANLAAFMDWLEDRGPATQVGTVDELIGGDMKPAVTWPPTESPPSGNLLQNPSLENDGNGDQVPDCWQRGGYGTNSATYQLVNAAFDGNVAQRITMTSFSSGGRRLVSAQSQPACAPAATPGRTYRMTGYYMANTPPRFSVYVRNPNGAWRWFAESPALPTSTTYRQAVYTTPAMPSDATAISVGLSIFNIGTITMDAFTLVDTAAPPPADTTPPTLAIACNGSACSTTAYTSPVTVSLTASDTGSGIDEIRYTTNGGDPANGTLYTGPFSISASATVRANAVDNAGNRTSQSVAITINSNPPPDTTPPTLAIACNGATCASGAYASAVTVSLTATDAGSDVSEIRYTTNGSDPANGTPYTGPFTVSASATVRATAVDNAGNRTSQSVTITIDDEDPPPPPAGNLLQNASLELDANSNQIPDCWSRGGYGTNTATFTLVNDAFDGSAAQRLDITSWSSGGRRLNSTQDAGACAPSATPGRTYTMTGYYKSNVQPRFSVYVRSTSGSWRWFAESAPLPASTVYRQATYTTPPLPPDATAISIGLSIFSVGSITTDAYTLVDASAPPPADTTAPALSIACNGATCSAAAYADAVTVSLTATDAGSGVDEVRYTTDGSDPATGALYTAPFTVSASATVRASAVDNAGNRASQSATIVIEESPTDTTPPALTISCNGGACAETAYASAVEVSLTASDTSGIAEVRYTTDGSDPTNGTLYAAPFTVSASATVRATAVDNAGNRATQSATITIDDEQPPPPANLLQNASLEVDANGNDIPDCWSRGGYGTNAATFTLVGDAFDGSVAQRLDITSWSSGGRRLNSTQDAGACAPSATPGARYTMTGYYKATVAPRFSVYVRSTNGSWRWFAESAPLPTSTTYTQATYTSPPLPSDTTAISIGLSIFSVGSITTDAYTLVEAAP